jgi:beta-N-acetylhexosaminidase
MRYSLFFSAIALSILIFTGKLAAQQSDPPFLKYINHPWVDSVLNSLSDDEKIAQLLWIPVYSNRDLAYNVETSNLVRKYKPGGVIFFQGNASSQAELINYFRSVSMVPPLIAIDGEWGIGMRLDNIDKFPYQMTLGAIENDSLIYIMGKAVGSQMKRAGVNINLAPVADVDNNPANPVINYRSFGEDPVAVGNKSLMYMKGMQENGIMAVAKHFPGHGDTDVDSHLSLPAIRHSRERLDSVELNPFRTLINNGISGVMPGHLWVPVIEPGTDIPSTISSNVLTDLLKKELEFKGLIISDAMNMGGITKYTQPGEAGFLALKAGMDILEYVTDPELTIRTVSDRLKKGEISREIIDEKCRKVLAAKFWAGLADARPVKKENITEEISTETIKALIRELYANAFTLLNNEQEIIPVKHLEKIRIATLALNSKTITSFQKRISDYTPADHYFIESFDDAKDSVLLNKLSDYDIVIAGIFNTDQRSQMNFGIPDGMNEFITRLNNNNKCIFSYFGNPYALAKLVSLNNSAGLLLAYQENEFTEDLSAQLIFGAIAAKGKLPVTVSDKYHKGYGIETPGGLRLQYGLPESTGISSLKLSAKIDSIATLGLNAGAYPGCEIMISHKGMVIYQKCYGYQTYDNRTAVAEEDLFDLASVSKIAGPLPGLMLLNSEGIFSPDNTLGYYLPYFRRSDKGDLGLRDMLAHQAGLVAWIPFWKETIRKNGEFKSRTLKHEQSEKYPYKVAENLYIYRNYRDKMLKEIKKSKLSDQKKYVYSDLTFIIVPDIIGNLTGEKWYDFVTGNIYHQLGAYDIGFNPYLKYPMERLIPTEYDSLFRKQQLRGYVHDEAAAMQGGISGHAGLFSTANDLMKLMEMYRRMGNYGGEQIINKDVIMEYTRTQFPGNMNRRGLGFDKPLIGNSGLPAENSYPSASASPESFGHSGFTGPFVWVDPRYEISYIFFCNGVYPTRNNKKLTDLNIRTDILQAIYDSIEEY